LSIEDSSSAQGHKCTPCGKDEFWSKLNGRCTPNELNQYVIFGEGQGVISDKSFNVLTSNGIMLPSKQAMPEYYLTGSWTIKTLVEIKGGLSFYIVDGTNEEKEYVIERFDRTLEKERNITINFVIKKSDLTQLGGSDFDKVFFRIKNQCCNIENKIRIVNFAFNFYSENMNNLVNYEPYPMITRKSNIMFKTTKCTTEVYKLLERVYLTQVMFGLLSEKLHMLKTYKHQPCHSNLYKTFWAYLKQELSDSTSKMMKKVSL